MRQHLQRSGGLTAKRNPRKLFLPVGWVDSGRPITVKGMVIDRLVAGRMADSRILINTLDIMQQLGALAVSGSSQRISSTDEALAPFFGNLGISEITRGKNPGISSSQRPGSNRKPRQATGHSTIHQEIVTLGQTLRSALRHGRLD